MNYKFNKQFTIRSLRKSSVYYMIKNKENEKKVLRDKLEVKITDIKTRAAEKGIKSEEDAIRVLEQAKEDLRNLEIDLQDAVGQGADDAIAATGRQEENKWQQKFSHNKDV